MPKPITKALHTARVFAVLAQHIRATSGHVGSSDGVDLYRQVLQLLGNADTTDATLRAALIAAVKS